MKRFLSLLIVSVLVLGVLPLALAEQTYDLKGATVNVRLWDSPNPYAEDAKDVDKEKWLPRYEEMMKKYNCKFDFYTTTTEWDKMPDEWILSVASGKPAWHITNNFSAMWLTQMIKNNAIADVKVGVDKLPMEDGLKQQGAFGGLQAGFVVDYPGTEALVFNRKMIKDAGMELDPGEMFEQGKWSYDEFFTYMSELQSKLPEGSFAFFIDPVYWAIFATPANGEMMIHPDFTLGMTSDAYIESMEFLKKLYDAKLIRPANVNDQGSPDYWGTPAATFDKGVEVAMTHRAMWQVGALNENKLDWGVVPYPWGSNVKLGTAGDYKTISDNYRTAYYDVGMLGVMLANVADDFKDTGLGKDEIIEALTALTFDLFIDQEKKDTLAKAAAGEKEEHEVDIGNFQDERSAILMDWMNQRTTFNPMGAIGSAGLWTNKTLLEGKELGFYGINRALFTDNLPIRATFEAAAQEINAAFKDAGMVK